MTKWDPLAPDACKDRAERSSRMFRGAGPDLGFLYSFKYQGYSVSDDYGDHAYTYYELLLIAHPIYKKTPQGWTLYEWAGARRKWVSKHTTKQYACPTIEEAITSFIAKRRVEISIHERKIKTAKAAIAAIEGKSLFDVA